MVQISGRLNLLDAKDPCYEGSQYSPELSSFKGEKDPPQYGEFDLPLEYELGIKYGWDF